MEKVTKVLVIGGTGIIGRELCLALLGKGHDVYVVSRRAVKDPSTGVHFITADASDKSSLSEALSSYFFDTVIDLVSFNKDQLLQTLGVISGKCNQYVLVSSATVYSGGDEIKEADNLITDGWIYPMQKIEAENILSAVAEDYGINYTIVRPYITYSDKRISFGEWEGFGIVESIKNQRPLVIGNELADTLTTLTHSYDLAAGISGLVLNPEAINETFHITSDESMTWRRVFEITANILNVPLNIVDVSVDVIKEDFPELVGKIEDRCRMRGFNNEKLNKALGGFECRYSVEDGYKEVINKYMSGENLSSHGYLQRGRIDRLVARYGSAEEIRELRSYRRSLMRDNLLNYIKYIVGYNKIIFMSARLVKSWIRKLKHIEDKYSLS